MAKTPVNRETVKKLIDALTPMSAETAEKFVQDILKIADERRRDVERVVGDVAKVGLRTAEGLATSVQHELGRQVAKMADRIDDLERQVENLNKALESTRANLMSIAERSLAKGSDAAEPGSPASTTTKKSVKGRKKSDKKSEKKSEKRLRSSKPDTTSSASEGAPTGESSAAVGGI